MATDPKFLKTPKPVRLLRTAMDSYSTFKAKRNFYHHVGGEARLITELRPLELNGVQRAKRRRECHGIWKASSDRDGICDRCMKTIDQSEGIYEAKLTKAEAKANWARAGITVIDGGKS